MIKKILAVATLLFAASGVQATTVIDFEDLTESQPGDADTTFISNGVTFTALQIRDNDDTLSIFDTDCTSAAGPNQCTGDNPASGDDGDLAFPGLDTFGLVLVVEDNNPVAPTGSDDEEVGGTILVDFGMATDVFELTFLDIESNSSDNSGVSLGDDLASLLVDLDSTGSDNLVFALLEDAVVGIFEIAAGSAFGAENNLVTVTDLGGITADQLVIDFRTSAALAEVVVPIPAALPLFMGGLAVLGFMRRRA